MEKYLSKSTGVFWFLIVIFFAPSRTFGEDQELDVLIQTWHRVPGIVGVSLAACDAEVRFVGEWRPRKNDKQRYPRFPFVTVSRDWVREEVGNTFRWKNDASGYLKVDLDSKAVELTADANEATLWKTEVVGKPPQATLSTTINGKSYYLVPNIGSRESFSEPSQFTLGAIVSESWTPQVNFNEVAP